MWNTLLDYSIIYSFDKTGYKRHAKRFSPLNSAKFAGKHYLVTGGTRGIGLSVTKSLLKMGAEVTVTARSSKDFDKNLANQPNAYFAELDLVNFDQIMATQFSVFDGVVLNAGGMPESLSVHDDQFDTIFGSQVAGHYVLLKRLIDDGLLKYKASVHWVASGGMYFQKLKLDDLDWEQTAYDKVKSYANAKRAQVIINELLAQRMKGYVFSCSHPGWVGTQALAQSLPAFTKKLGNRLRTPAQGADTILWCLEQGTKLKGGLFWFDRKSRMTNPFFWTKERESDRLALWNLLESTWHKVKNQAETLPQFTEPKAETSVN
jgi:dehydrogenase/reductase SDR family protein 12